MKEVCSYCQREFSGKNVRTLDHIEPLVKLKKKRISGGYLSSFWRLGKKHKDNLLLSCYKCNCTKGGRTLEEFKMFLETGKKIPGYITPEIKENILRSINVLLTTKDTNEITYTLRQSNYW